MSSSSEFESNVIAAVAKLAAGRITRKVIADLQQMHQTLSGDDSGLVTTWDEICVQVQYEESVDWAVYDETVRALVDAYVEDLPAHERDALFLQTQTGQDWLDEDSSEHIPCPVSDDDIVDYITTLFVYHEATNWSNARIRAFLDRRARRD